MKGVRGLGRWHTVAPGPLILRSGYLFGDSFLYIFPSKGRFVPTAISNLTQNPKKKKRAILSFASFFIFIHSALLNSGGPKRNLIVLSIIPLYNLTILV